MEFNELIQKAIKKDEVVKILRGNAEYEIAVSEFTSDAFPTDINSVLMNYFYKQSKEIENISTIFTRAYNQLLRGNASDIYIAVLYFDACIFQEERGKASFSIDRKLMSLKLQEQIQRNKDELHDSVEFDNGMKKLNPWNNIVNFNKYYETKYGISIIINSQ